MNQAEAMEGRDEGAISAVVRPGDQRRGKKIVERERGKETRREMAKSGQWYSH